MIECFNMTSSLAEVNNYTVFTKQHLKTEEKNTVRLSHKMILLKTRKSDHFKFIQREGTRN